MKECQNLISKEIDSTKKLITTGKSVIHNGADLAEFTVNARLLGRLPEVPELKDVPYITFCYEKYAEKAVKNVLANFGNVFRFPPVQVGIMKY